MTGDRSDIKHNIEIVLSPHLLTKKGIVAVPHLLTKTLIEEKQTGKAVHRILAHRILDRRGRPYEKGSIVYKEMPDYMTLEYNPQTGTVTLYSVERDMFDNIGKKTPQDRVSVHTRRPMPTAANLGAPAPGMRRPKPMKWWPP